MNERKKVKRVALVAWLFEDHLRSFELKLHSPEFVPL